jgi:hypothetical protein
MYVIKDSHIYYPKWLLLKKRQGIYSKTFEKNEYAFLLKILKKFSNNFYKEEEIIFIS